MREEDCVHTAPSHDKQRTDAGLVSSLVAEDQLQGSFWQLLGLVVPVGVTPVSQWRFLQSTVIHCRALFAPRVTKWSIFLVRSKERDMYKSNLLFKILTITRLCVCCSVLVNFFLSSRYFSRSCLSLFFWPYANLCLCRYRRILGLQDLESTKHWAKHWPSSRQLDTEYSEKMMFNHVENFAICISTMIHR